MKMKKDVKRALVGEDDYHALMRSIAVSSLRRKAGYVPPKMDAPIPEKNLMNWQSKKLDIAMGVEWVFYAVECGHFSPSEAKKIWRYGQAIKKAENARYRTKKLQVDISWAMDWFVLQVRNQSDWYNEYYDETKVWDNGRFEYAYDNLDNPHRGSSHFKNVMRTPIINMYGGLFIYIHYANNTGLDLFEDNFSDILGQIP